MISTLVEDAPITDVEQSTAGINILIIEDDSSLTASLSYYLRKNGFSVLSAGDGVEGLRLAREERPEAILLDLMLPQMDGLEVCRRLRADLDTPVIMLTARSEETDRIIGLELGADDYITKPFSLRELLARLRAVIRRSERREATRHSPRLVLGRFEVDQRGRTVRRGGAEVRLKPKEFDLLYLLASEHGRVFTRQQLLDAIWGYDFYGGSRTLDVHIRWLREKLEDEPSNPRHLLTVRGVGYKFVR